MANRWGNSGWLYFGGSKITADGDCIHEIKRHLLLGKKVITNLDSILKRRDVTLITEVCLDKATVFPVVMYGWESWTMKKADCWRMDAFFYIYIIFFCVVARGCLAMNSAFSWQNSFSLCPASFHTPRPNLPGTPGVSFFFFICSGFLSYIEMKQPWVYMCSPSWSPLPPPSPPAPSRSSQCTRSERLSHASNVG